MLIIPAIDIIDGKCVRLFQGDYGQETVYNENPLDQAKEWQDKGARLIHIVDLDAARDGTSNNRSIIEKIVNTISADVEVGGGVRSFDDVRELFEAGVKRVVIGSRAIEAPEFVKDLIEEYNSDSIVVGIDSRHRMVAYHGWTEETEYRDIEFLKFIHNRAGVKRVIYTDILRDGTLTGPNIEALIEMLEFSDDIHIVCSGGISSEGDIEKLHLLKHKNLEGVITGKALYNHRIDLVSVISKFQESD
ncbi:MAG: 1-(5-phosphoribosyl)-5-[(5-phosphoribosylamino)methylideneamino]imidazole-4-carboxamide isomerase [Candidatus Aureabacteria bacterium]|nr:1-(5-phosphoribosyl)-5-[(5-phosphoribosylamino)methylideneamino]imidazole-4-carboxamide isomerase [Candidatus Auribacterota bacterium]